jgi:hypothetical protein
MVGTLGTCILKFIDPCYKAKHVYEGWIDGGVEKAHYRSSTSGTVGTGTYRVLISK